MLGAEAPVKDEEDGQALLVAQAVLAAAVLALLL